MKFEDCILTENPTMRPDFNKLLCERQRAGVKGAKFFKRRGRDNFNKNQSYDEDFDGGSLVSPMRGRLPGHRTKYLNENLSPLINFLINSIGRKWDKVYSEICENLRKDKAINLHVFQHLYQYVDVNTRMADDNKTVMIFSPYGGWLSANQDSYDQYSFYVHPLTGILLKRKHKSRRKQFDWRFFFHPKDRKIMFYLDDNHKWWEVKFHFFTEEEYCLECKSTLYPTKTHTVFEHKCILAGTEKNPYLLPKKQKSFNLNGKKITDEFAPYWNAFSLTQFWGEPKKAVSMRLLSEKEIQDFNLKKKKLKADNHPRENPRYPSI